jgi:hypothetical protein
VSTATLRCSVGDLSVLSGSLVLPLRGNWTATLTAHGKTAPAEGSPASLIFKRENGALDTFTGTVRRAGVAAGSVALSCTIVGGAGKLLADLPPRDHAPGVTEIPAGLVARGICDDAGEMLADGVEFAADALTVHRWTRIAMPARDALDLLADVLGWGWRVLDSGKVWAGPETWAAASVTKFLSAVPDDAGDVYATDGAPLRPGVTLSTPEGDRRLVEVVYSVSPGAARATVRAAVAGDPPPVRGSRELYAVSYGATVREQADDGSLVVSCDDPRLDVLRGVPLRVGIPGCTVTVPVGARLRVRFENADPRGAYACALDQDPTAGAAFALVGDGVDCGAIQVTAPAGGGACTVIYTSPGGLIPFGAQSLGGIITGPGHKYAKGVSGP